MKTKISKFLGVGLAVMLVLSLAFALMPAQQAQAAPAQWTPESGPGAAGTNAVLACNVNGMAVASDGYTIYVIDNQPAGTALDQILKSVNGGRTFAALTTAATIGGTGPFVKVAVAPDNPNVVAVCDSAATAGATGLVYVSRDGGVNWITLPFLPGAALNTVFDLAVGPQRANAAVLDGRDIAVATSFATTLLQTTSNVFVIGQTLAWTLVGSAVGGASNYDFTSVKFSPGYIGDRVIIAVGSNGTADAITNGTYLFLINLGAQWGAATAAYVPSPGAPVLIQALPIDTGAGVTNILTSSIALPSGFDPTTPNGQRVWVGMATTGAGATTDVFRIDFLTVRKLGIAADVAINSISYSGDFNSGTLIAGATAFAGGTNLIQTWYSNDPTVAFPTWAGSSKPPTGTANAIVACAPDFPASKKVFAGTSDTGVGQESALSISNNGGVSFNQVSLIDTAINGLSDVMVTPDGKTIFLATWNTATGAGLESLWKSPVPITAAGWDRVRTSPANWFNTVGDSIIRLNPDYANAPVVFWADAGATATAAIQASIDGGDVFVARNTLPVAIGDLAVESATVVYAASGTNIYRSDSAAWNFNVGPVNAGIGPINMIAMAPTYPLLPKAGNLLVGGAAGAVNWSTASANPGSFGPPASTGLGAATGMQVVADSNYATNNTIYAGCGAGANNLFRWVIGTDTLWSTIAAAPAVTSTTGFTTGMVATNGALYAGWVGAGATTTLTSEPLQAVITVAAVVDGGDGLPESFTLDYVDQGTAASTTPAILIPNNAALGATFPITLAALDTGVIDVTPTAGSVIVTSDTAAATVVSIQGTLTGTVYGTIALAGVYADGAIPVWPVVIPVAVASGADRALDPTDAGGTITWTTMNAGAAAAAAFNATPSSLRIDATASPTLYAIDTAGAAGAGLLLSYLDLMATAKTTTTAPATVAIDPVSGRAVPVVVNWTAMGFGPGLANTYQVFIFEKTAGPASAAAFPVPLFGPAVSAPNTTIFPDGTGPNIDFVFVSGTEYGIMIRAFNEVSGDAIVSPFSAPVYIAVATGGVQVEMVPPLVVPPVTVTVPVPPAEVISPAWIWAVVIIGAILVIAVIALIFTTRKTT